MWIISLEDASLDNVKKGKRKVQGVPQSQTKALPRPQEEEETDKSKQAQTKQTISSLFPKRGNRNTKRIEKHKNKLTHGKTYNKSPRRTNHKATKSKTNTGTTALEQLAETYFLWKINRLIINKKFKMLSATNFAWRLKGIWINKSNNHIFTN